MAKLIKMHDLGQKNHVLDRDTNRCHMINLFQQSMLGGNAGCCNHYPSNLFSIIIIICIYICSVCTFLLSIGILFLFHTSDSALAIDCAVSIHYKC